MAKIAYIHKIENSLTFAINCPFCQREGGSLESQVTSVKDNILTIENGFECVYCYEVWNQTIEAKIGEVIKNEICD